MKTNSYLPINWTDGVKLTKDHFTENYLNFITVVNDYNNVRLNEFNYGIIDAASETSFQLDSKIESDTHLIVTLKQCNIIAKNGHHILFNSKIYGEDFPQASINATDLDQNVTDTFYVVVSINPYKLIPVGIPDPEIVPLHHPHVAPEIKLHIINQNAINQNFLESYFLILKKYKLQNGTFVENKKYIAPVVKAKNNATLMQFISNVNTELHQLYDYSIKINKKNIYNSANNKLVLNTFSLCDKIIQFYVENNFYLKNIAKEESPIYMSEKIIILANSLLSALTIMDEKEKEMLLQYYYEWVDVKPSELLSILFTVKDIVYDHNDINETLDKLDQFSGILKKLWKKLSELEYIGLRKENIVISEETKTAAPKSRTWSILD